MPTCPTCNTENPENVETTYDGSAICENCNDDFVQCDSCGYACPSDRYYSANGGCVCPSCISSFTFCSSCDEYVSGPCSDYEEDCGLVGSEEHPNNDISRTIMNYSADVLNYHPFNTLPGEHSPIYTGIELEVAWKGTLEWDKRLSNLSRLYKALNYVIFKSDSSIEEGGFELVTAPATLGFHRKAFAKAFPILSEFTKGWNGRGCGMHVHVSRDAFNGPSHKAHIYKWTEFINSQPNISFTSLIAGRDITCEHYCQATSTKMDIWNPQLEGRYRPVNFGRPQTLECRIFRSNIAKVGFFKNLDYIYASLEFTRHAGLSPKALHHQTFLEWLSKNQHKYYYLASFLHDRHTPNYPMAKKRLEKETSLEA